MSQSVEIYLRQINWNWLRFPCTAHISYLEGHVVVVVTFSVNTWEGGRKTLVRP